MLSLVYVSSATPPLAEPELDALLAAVRPRNEERGITGLLVYIGGGFDRLNHRGELLEGPDDAVEEVFSAIAADPRHTDVEVLVREQVAERGFPDWAMAYRRYEPGETPQGWSAWLEQGAAERRSPHASRRMLELFRASVR